MRKNNKASIFDVFGDPDDPEIPKAVVKEFDHISILAEAVPCQPDHPYLRRMALEGAPCQVYPGVAEIDGTLCSGGIIFAIYDAEGEHVDTALMIHRQDEDAVQLLVNGCHTQGYFGKIGTGSGPILIVPDWASGMSLYLATGERVAVACSAENMITVCKALAAKHSGAELILCIPGDIAATNLATLQAVAESTGALTASPTDTFDEARSFSTFNALHQARGLDAVALQIDVARHPDKAISDESADAPVVDLSPWPQALDGRWLFRTLVREVTRYTVLPRFMAVAIALWIISAHAHKVARVSPFLSLCSPVKRCGKTGLLSLLKQLVPRPELTSNITAAGIFRAIERDRSTLLLDEADTYIWKSADLIGILNSGHVRDGARVNRVERGQTRSFSTWAPKSLAMIGRPPETILDRSIAIPLKRKRPEELVEKLSAIRPKEREILYRQIARWVADNLTAIGRTQLEPLALGNDRTADNWEPLRKIAKRIGEACYEAAVDAAQELTSLQNTLPSIEEILLADIHAIFKLKNLTKIKSADLLLALCADDDKPWAIYHKGQAILAKELVDLLEKFGIHSENVRHGKVVPKGYTRAQFEDAFARYVPNAID